MVLVRNVAILLRLGVAQGVVLESQGKQERDAALGIQSLGKALYFLFRCFPDYCWIIAC